MMIRSFCGKLKGLSILCTPGVLCDTGVAPSTLNTAFINADFPAPDFPTTRMRRRGHSWRRISV
ncbi:hypothetical protein B0H17DRAFT_1105244 [Mycena rosella]|uniref:Uncharacterized protein n=1 Tax=Mycena rosella TaxID=1033263 RepID=A0AAD7FW47_MYCRO|nr:hypothetical protein B0H17DRAFT_1105244 [Mycena rosella]